MYSAFGVDHGDYVEKAFNPVKGLKAAGANFARKSQNKNYQRGFNQATNSRGIAAGQNTSPTLLGGISNRLGGKAYGQGQAQGARHAEYLKSNRHLDNPFG